MTSGRSPSTSDSRTDTTRAGAQCCAKRPPFTAERRLRTAFIAAISAPLRRSRCVISRRRASGTSGSSNRALAPPDSSTRTVSSAVSPCVSASARRAAAKARASGTGCPASASSSGGSAPPRWPSLVMTIPRRTGTQAQAACAMAHAAFPAARSTILPVSRSAASASRTSRPGCAAATASRRIVSASSRIVCMHITLFFSQYSEHRIGLSRAKGSSDSISKSSVIRRR